MTSWVAAGVVSEGGPRTAGLQAHESPAATRLSEQVLFQREQGQNRHGAMAVSLNHEQRVAAATRVHDDPATARGRAATRTRYHGTGIKGPPPLEARAATMVRLAVGELQACAEQLGRIAIIRDELPPRELREHREVVRSKLALAARMLDELVDPMTAEERRFDDERFGRGG